MKTHRAIDDMPVPGREWDRAPATIHETEQEVLIAIDGNPFTADMFHMLPDTRDWISLLVGDLTVIGRCYLDRNFLDLVVEDKAHSLKAVAIPFEELDILHPRIQEFMRPLRFAKPVCIIGHQWFSPLPAPPEAPVVTINKKAGR